MLEIRVDDYDTLGANDFMGKVEIPLASLTDKLRHKEWHVLLDQDGSHDQERGSVQLVLWWKHLEPARRTASMTPTPAHFPHISDAQRPNPPTSISVWKFEQWSRQ